jgi:hypothetical protein
VQGTPRLTVLVGSDAARVLWDQWIVLTGVENALLYETSSSASFAEALKRGLDETTRRPARAVAVWAGESELAGWRAAATDRARTLIDEGCIYVHETPATELTGGPRATRGGRAISMLDARSVAEAVLFEALESTPSTKGHFELNGYLSVRFGSDAAEVDLLSRQHQIAVEIDGYHHFTDADAYRRDRRKDVLLQAHGLFVIRLLADDVVRDPASAVNLICQAMASRKEPDADR